MCGREAVMSAAVSAAPAERIGAEYVGFIFVLHGVQCGLAYVLVVGSGLVVCGRFLWFVVCIWLSDLTVHSLCFL